MKGSRETSGVLTTIRVYITGVIHFINQIEAKPLGLEAWDWLGPVAHSRVSRSVGRLFVGDEGEEVGERRQGG